jgi:DNA polymerase eta
LWKELFGNSTDLKLSTVSLSFTGIDIAETGQQTIEGFLRSKPLSKRNREDSRERPGEPRAEEAMAMERSTVAPGAGSNEVDDQNPSRSSSRTELSYTCSRCQKTLRATVFPIHDGDDDEREAMLASLKLEHEDWHFAQDLAREEVSRSNGGNTKRLVAGQQPQGSKPKKRRKEAVGIEKFFARK